MDALKRYKYHLLAILILITLLVVGAHTRLAQVNASADELPRVEQAFQLEHALELFPDDKASLALLTTPVVDQREFILSVVRQSLAESQAGKAFEIARAVIVEANHHHMDPLFLLAIIATESKFNIEARGTHGEIGLMQILPKTAAWMAAQAGLPEDFDLQEPVVNIRIGATYISQLRHSFRRRSKRYVAAYNMGSANVRKVIALTSKEPELYPTRVLNNYEQIYASLNSLSSVNPTDARGLASVR